MIIITEFIHFISNRIKKKKPTDSDVQKKVEYPG